jgi:bacterial/archaeal transporter family protein
MNHSCQLWAVLAKVGVEGITADFATFIRTVVIVVALGAILSGAGQWQPLGAVCGRSYVNHVLSGLRRRASPLRD